MTKRITMADIAREARVHKTTVSLALRGHPSIPEATRRRLRGIADRLGYRPDPALRALADYRNGKVSSSHRASLAYLTDWGDRWGWREDPTQAAIFAGAQARAEVLGYRLECFWLGEPHMTHRRMGDILESRSIHGVVLGAFDPRRDCAVELNWERLCGIKIGNLPTSPRMTRVAPDTQRSVHTAMKHLRTRGYRRVGMIVQRDSLNVTSCCWAAQLQGQLLMTRDAPLIPVLSPTPSDDSTAVTSLAGSPAQQVRRWLDAQKPEVVLGCGRVVLPWLQAAGATIPDDVAFVDLDLSSSAADIAGVRPNYPVVGETAIEMLAIQLEQHRFGLPALGTTTLVEGTWCDGASLPTARPSLNRAAS
ncbi:LacI family DNA-binding transcriptional regulator [Synoicihabitans lomoniglobus]|uniref:LacI family DNA-binding transcriptional regulator n=1 Tax=Synoicihabitans lomoniglobus TaxID=2909285 RepID=A0AAE9ZXL0_9BACT|nr:LacI family transcriptional regulator [Opitutaceae bacterium LMO-M01]WED65139.1 LacI family DNA-binding transcriptional regulator [Opitutaceae bacterium LMO-M01]